mgnify:CR=1 FL=1
MPRIGRPLSNTDCGARGLPVAGPLHLGGLLSRHVADLARIGRRVEEPVDGALARRHAEPELDELARAGLRRGASRAIATTIAALGLTGPVGPIGLTGAVGPAGPQGLMGDPGVQGPVGPIGDSLMARMAVRHRLDFGAMRLWGSLGFALVALATARAAATRSIAGMLASGVATLATAYGFAMLMLPGLFRLADRKSVV